MANTHYDCQQVVERMGDYLDRELSAEEVALVKEHLEACWECKNAFRWEDSVLRLVKSKCESTTDMPEGLEDEILGSIRLSD